MHSASEMTTIRHETVTLHQSEAAGEDSRHQGLVMFFFLTVEGSFATQALPFHEWTGITPRTGVLDSPSGQRSHPPFTAGRQRGHEPDVLHSRRTSGRIRPETPLRRCRPFWWTSATFNRALCRGAAGWRSHGTDEIVEQTS